MRRNIVILTLLGATAGCSFIARGEDQYRTDTRTLLETRNAQIKSCYDQQLASSPNASGNVIVEFTVEKKTGTLSNIHATEASTAPAPVQDCVVQALEGLQLTPEDRRDGQATFTYTFTAPGGA